MEERMVIGGRAIEVEDVVDQLDELKFVSSEELGGIGVLYFSIEIEWRGVGMLR